jgi:hypothetical protein
MITTRTWNMMKRTRRARKSGPQRRWHLTPPLLHGSEALEGGEILHEAAGGLGVALWQAARDVTLWSLAPPAERGGVFSEGAAARRRGATAAAEGTGIEGSFETLLGMVTEPSRASAPAVSLACRQIAQWAESEGRRGTALAFAQAGALAMPGDVGAAFAMGRMAHGAGDAARAEVWYRRAIGLARRSRDWRLYARSFRGLGRLASERGDAPAARYHLIRALRGGRRGGMRLEQAIALHELFLVVTQANRVEEADRLAVAAFEAYGSRDDRLRALATDLVAAWGSQGRSDLAAPLAAVLGIAVPDPRPGATGYEPTGAAARAAESLAASLVNRLGAG